MKQIREKLTYANVMSTIAVVLVVGGGTAFAASHLGKNVVKSRNIAPGAVTTKDLAKSAVKQAKIGSSAVDSSKIAENAVTNGKIAAGSVGEAKLAPDVIGKLNAVQASPIVRVDAAGTSPADSPARTLISRGPFSVYGKCYTSGGSTAARTYIATTASGTLATGATVAFRGGNGSPYMNALIPEDDRRISSVSTTAPTAAGFGGAATMINGSTSVSVAVNGWVKGSQVLADDTNYGAGGPRCLFSAYLLAASG